MRVAMLGPLEVRTDGDPGEIVEVTGSRLRTLLIMLALHPGQLVTSGQLIDGLWTEEVPAGAANALQALVSRLRRAVPQAVTESRPSGYRLMLDPRSTDEPVRTARLIPSSATVSPNRLTSPSVTIEDVMNPRCRPALTPHPDPADAPDPPLTSR